MKEVQVLCLTYGRLSELVSGAKARLSDEHIRITALEGLSEMMVEEIGQAIRDGVNVIVAGGSNASFVRQNFDIPVVQIRTSAYDYVVAIDRAKKLGCKIAVVVLENGLRQDIQTMAELLGANLTVVTYSIGADLEQVIRDSGAEVVIGAGHAVQVAERMNLPNVLIYPGEETVAEAILEANKLVKEMWRERERNELTAALIRYTPNSIVIINDQGKIIEFNREAEKAYGKPAASATEVLPESGLEELLQVDCDRDSAIRTIGDRMYLQKQIRIFQEEQVMGAIEILAELSDIRHAEYRYSVEQEKKNQLKGFYAKTHFSDIIGTSKTIRETLEEAKIFARSDASILIFGETGTGKELFAQSIHNYSPRRKGPFIAINCAALPESLLESELFGYEEGAFTGSKKGGKMGIFELANGGTIFLDEIGEIGLGLQARLLRALQEKEVMRIGGERIYRFDARVLAATNKDIIHMSGKEFRRDLLYRLKVLELELPPLRQRGNDVKEIFLSFFHRCIDLSDHDLELPPAALELLLHYSWPGNVRELQNVCERFCIYLSQNVQPSPRLLKRYMLRAIGEERFVEDLLNRSGYCPENRDTPPELLTGLARDLRAYLNYNNDQIASVLGISRTTLWRLEKKDRFKKDTISSFETKPQDSASKNSEK